jgi:hypothetical protein
MRNADQLTTHRIDPAGVTLGNAPRHNLAVRQVSGDASGYQ